MTVDQIFNDAKKRFSWQSDQSTFGEPEYWATIKELQANSVHGEITGDCDDFASYCVSNLRAAGLHGRYVFCRCETGELHCVAETDGIILDNRKEFPTPQSRMQYTWISISGYKSGEAWHKIIQ